MDIAIKAVLLQYGLQAFINTSLEDRGTSLRVKNNLCCLAVCLPRVITPPF
jgi:hypothetical protein